VIKSLKFVGSQNVRVNEFDLTPGQIPGFVPCLAHCDNPIIRQAVVETTAERSTFSVAGQADATKLGEWLASWDCRSFVEDSQRNGLYLVRSLKIASPSLGSQSPEMQLAQRCGNLDTLEVELALSHMVLKALAESHNATITMEAAGKKDPANVMVQDLQSLSGLKKLKVIKVAFTTPSGGPFLVQADELLLLSWLREQLIEGGRTFKLVPGFWIEASTAEEFLALGD
jgi:hypothetical protein